MSDRSSTSDCSGEGAVGRPQEPPDEGSNLSTLLELDGPAPTPMKVAAFLRHYAGVIRKNERWDIPETMANAYESAASALERWLTSQKTLLALGRIGRQHSDASEADELRAMREFVAAPDRSLPDPQEPK